MRPAEPRARRAAARQPCRAAPAAIPPAHACCAHAVGSARRTFIFRAMRLRNSGKSMVPLPSASTSLIMSCSSASVGFWPSERITVPSSLVVMVPARGRGGPGAGGSAGGRCPGACCRSGVAAPSNAWLCARMRPRRMHARSRGFHIAAVTGRAPSEGLAASPRARLRPPCRCESARAVGGNVLARADRSAPLGARSRQKRTVAILVKERERLLELGAGRGQRWCDRCASEQGRAPRPAGAAG